MTDDTHDCTDFWPETPLRAETFEYQGLPVIIETARCMECETRLQRVSREVETFADDTLSAVDAMREAFAADGE